MNKLFAICVCVLTFCQVTAQKFYPANTGDILFGQGWTSEVGKKYQRFPDRASATVPSGVWGLSKNTAGLNVRFVTDATTITVKYTITSGAAGYANMPATLQSGIDMYALPNDSTYYWVSPQKKFTFSGTNCTYKYENLEPIGLTGKKECTYLVYFPMYNNVTSMSIGVPEGSTFEFVKVPEDDQPIVVYGSSIAQGCSASRPGMAWPAIIARELNSNVINLGFSGSAMMESSLFDMMAELKNAKLFILDPVPNIKSAPGSIVSRTLDGVRKLRSVTKAPILLVESLGNSNKVMQPNEENIDSKGNKKLKEAYEALLDEDIKNVFYLTEEEIGLTEDGMIEGTHPNDIGMREYADAYVKKIKWLFEHIDTTQVNNQHPLYEITRTGKQMLKSWVFGENPGETPIGLKGEMEALLASAQDAIDKNEKVEEAEYAELKEALQEKMDELRDTRNPLEDGYYYIVSAYDGFMAYNDYEVAMYSQGSAVNWKKLDETDPSFIYKLTKQESGNWAIQNGATSTYLNTSAHQKPLTMSKTLTTEQVVTPAMEWSARFRISNTANANPYIPNSNHFGAATSSNVFNQSEDIYNANDPTSTAYGWQTWYIRKVTDAELLNKVTSEMKTEATIQLETKLANAEAVYDRAMVFKANEDEALITNGEDKDEDCQFSSNAKMPENTRVWGYYRDLLDGNLATFLISIHDASLATPPSTYHYLQVDLQEHPVDAFIFRCGCTTTWPTFAIKDVIVMASNDGENWKQVDELLNLPTSGTYDSKCVRMWEKYRYIRFNVVSTKSNSPMAGGGPSFAIGEFQMFPVISATDSPYNTIESVKTETDKLTEMMAAARKKVTDNTATADDVAALTAQIENVLAAIRGDNATEALADLVDEATALYNKAFVPTIDDTQKLIIEADDDDEAHNQFSSNAKMPENTSNWGYYRHLIDNNAGTYFITNHNSAYMTPPTGRHYLQVDLREQDVDAFIFRFVRSTTWPTFTWKNITVSASKDNENWDIIGDLNDLPSSATYDSPCVHLWNSYRYVRFSVNTTENNLVVGGGPCFSVGDFQMYPVKAGENSIYATNETAKAAIDELKAAIATSRTLIAANQAKQPDVDNLKSKMSIVKAIIEDNKTATEVLAEMIDEAKALYNEALNPTIDDSQKLITEADDDDEAHNQFSSNAKMPENTSVWGYYRHLIDDNAGTFFITNHNPAYMEPPTGRHYLQVDLREQEVDAFIFRFVRSTSWPTFTWKNITVSASKDNENWDIIGDLNDLPSSATYDSPCVQMWDSYRYVRFSVNKTENNLVTGGGPCFSVGDFQMYPVKAGESSVYATNETAKAAIEELKAVIAASNALIAAKEAEQSDVDNLKSKMSAVKTFIQENK